MKTFDDFICKNINLGLIVSAGGGLCASFSGESLMVLSLPFSETCTDVFAGSGKHLHPPYVYQRTCQIWGAHRSGVRG